MYQPSGAESYSGPDLKSWGAGTLGLGREGAAGGRVEANNNRTAEMVASWADSSRALWMWNRCLLASTEILLRRHQPQK